MKKNFLSFKTLCLLLCIGIFASCSSKKSIYETLIPVQPESIVAGIKLNQVLTKSDIKGLLPEATRAELLNGLIAEAGVRRFVADLINDAPKTGLNCDENIYLVINQTADGGFDLSFYLAVDNLSKLEGYIAGNSMYSQEANKVGDFNHAVANVSGQPLNALYNKNIFMLTVSDDLIAKTEPTQVLTSHKWADAFSSNDDLTVVAQSNLIQNISQFVMTLTSGYPANDLTGIELPQGLYQTMSLNFEKGQVAYAQKMFATSPQADEFVKMSESIFGNTSNKFVSQVAVDPFLYLNTSVVGDKLLSYMNFVFGGNDSALGIGENNIKTIKEAVDAVNGDLTLAISDVNINFLKPSVDFSVFCEAKPTLYPFLVNLIKESPNGLSAIQFETDKVLTLSERGFTVYLVNAGNHIILTTDESLSEDPSMKMESDFTKSRYYKKQDDKMYFVIDIQKILAIPMVQVALSSMPKDRFPGVADFITALDYVEVSGDSTISKSKLVIKNKEDNSLKLITALLKSLAHL